MDKKFIIPVVCGIVSSLFIGPIGLYVGFKAGTIALSSSLSFSIVTGIGIYSQNSKYQEKLDKKWENEYNKLISENTNIMNEWDNNSLGNVEKLSEKLFKFFILQRKNKSLSKADPDIIIDAKLYLKYMNLYTENKIGSEVEKIVFKNIYNK